MDQNNPHSPPQQELSASEKDARQWGMLCHLAALATFVAPSFGNIIGPLVVWLWKRNEHPFVDEQGKESVNFQISISIYTWVSALVLAATCVGLVLIPIVALIPIVGLVMAVIAAMKASSGEAYRYPLTIRFLK